MMLVVVACVVVASLCWPRSRTPRERIADITPSRPRERAATQHLRRPVVLAAVLAVVALLAAGGSVWWVAALVAAGVVGARVRPKPVVAPEDVALVADLMAACMIGGANIADALAAAASAVAGLTRDLAEPVLDGLRRGAAPDAAWDTWLADERLAPVARSCVRSSGSGAAVAAELTRVAVRVRLRQRALAHERAARASVWVVLPLGLCFLPAFVLVGVVPLVLGLLATLQ